MQSVVDHVAETPTPHRFTRKSTKRAASFEPGWLLRVFWRFLLRTVDAPIAPLDPPLPAQNHEEEGALFEAAPWIRVHTQVFVLPGNICP